MSRTRLAVAAVLLLPPAAAACLWDYDTLAQERGRFPTVLELITGKYLRHSPEFYEWRAADRRKRLLADPANLNLHDDLVVALDRLGRYDEALKAVEAAARLRPGRYETEANWGTVLLHAGRLEEGLAHIDAAVRINPDAHFGREVYQQKLVRWVIDARKAGRTLPVSMLYVTDSDPAPVAKAIGEDWLSLPAWHLREERVAVRAAALKGVLGMMRSGPHDNPLLLESLGRLLSTGEEDLPEDDAKRLAARAYLRAADVVADPAAKQAYRGLARNALEMQTGVTTTADQLSLDQLERDFRRELADAEAWYAELRAKEIAWVNGGAADPDAAFAALYAADPEVIGDGSTVPGPAAVWWRTNGIVVVGLGLLAGGLAYGAYRLVRRRAKISAPHRPV